ncbi:MAG: hypothetical protein WD733_03205 [Bryobacterales bacterium]
MRWVAKTRTVRIATHEGDQVYHSIEDVPQELRQIVKQTLEGPNSETVLIANQEAYDRLSRQFRELPDGFEEIARTPVESAAKPPVKLWAWTAAAVLMLILSLALAWGFLIRTGTS